MYFHQMPMVTEDQLRATMLEELTEEQRNHSLYLRVRAALVPFEGKQTSKRLHTAVVSVIPQHEFPSMYYDYKITFSAGKDLLTFYFNQHDAFSLDNFDTRNVRYGSACAKRIAQAEKVLADPFALAALANTINTVNNTLTALNKLDEIVPYSYAFEKYLTCK